MKIRLALTVVFLSTFMIYPSAVPASSDNVELLSWWPSGKCVSAAYDDNHVYYSMGATLAIADVTTPSAPVELGMLTMGGEVASIAVSGDYAYVANRQNGLRVIDISAPGSPTEVGYYVTPGSAHRVTVEGAYAYVLTSEATLRVIDITTPPSPVEVGTLGIDEADDVVTSGDYAYVAAMSQGLRVVDVSTPSSPTEVGSYSTPSDAKRVDFDPLNTRVLVADAWAGLRVISVDIPSNPVEVGSCFTTDNDVRDVLVAGNLCFALSTVYNLDFMYFSGGYLRITDVSAPAPAHVGTEWFEHDDFYDMDYGPDCLYVANGSSGLRVIDVTTPSSPDAIADIRTGDFVEKVQIVGDYAYVANREAGLTILDVSDPGAPVEVGFYDHGDDQHRVYHSYNRTLDVAVSGDYAFLAENQGLLILDVSDPFTPVVVSSYAPYCCTGPWPVHDVTLSGDYAYLGVYSSLSIIDVTMGWPQEVGSYYHGYYYARASVSGDHAYIAARSGGLRVVDVSTPSTPVEVGSYTPSGTNVRDLALSGDYAYLADYTAGLRIVDVSTPSSPVEVSRYDTPGTALAVDYSGGYAFVADGTGGLRVINVANPVDLEEVAYGGTSFPATSVAVDGNDVYVGSDDGMYIMRLDPALVGVTTTSSFKSALHQNHPNPFNPSTTIRYELADAGRVNLTIYSVEGKHVRTLVDEVESAGSHDVVWDGRNDAGVRVGSGVYFCTMRAGSCVQTRRLVLLK